MAFYPVKIFAIIIIIIIIIIVIIIIIKELGIWEYGILLFLTCFLFNIRDGSLL